MKHILTLSRIYKCVNGLIQVGICADYVSELVGE